jgi:hypothetical protein
MVKIWQYFGDYFHKNDSYKDAEGKGLLQRYNELIEEDIQSNIYPMMNSLLDNLLLASTMLDRFVGDLEYTVGLQLRFSDLISLRKNILKYIFYFYKIKGTRRGYEVLLRWLGFESVVITEFWANGGLDSSVDLDDINRRFDSGGKCSGCSEYEIALTGSVAISPDLLRYIHNIVKFNEPINARLRRITYNGNDMSSLFYFILKNADLIFYDDSTDYDFEVTRDDNGNLIITGIDSNKWGTAYPDAIFNN